MTISFVCHAKMHLNKLVCNLSCIAFLFSAFWLRVTTVIFFYLSFVCLWVRYVQIIAALFQFLCFCFLSVHISEQPFSFIANVWLALLCPLRVCVCVSRSYEFLSIPWLFYSTTRRIRRLISLSIKYAWTDRAGLYWISKHRNWYIEQLYFLKLSSFYRK